MSSLKAFLEMLDRIPWLEHLGQANAHDHEVFRLHAWDEWPGPEHPNCRRWYAFFMATCNQTFDRAGSLRKYAKELMDQAGNSVFERACRRTSFDPKAGVGHGPSQSPRDAAAWAGLIAARLLLGLDLSNHIVRIWLWFEAGHWPCGYASGKRLLVY